MASIDSPAANKTSGNGGISGLALLVASAFFMEFLDGTIIVTALPQMAREFGVTALDLNIGVSAYLLTMAVLIPANGWIAERFGARKVFTSALVIFTFSSLMCGLASTLTEFVAMRVLQGIGGAMMVPVGRLIVLKTTPKDQLIKVIATLTWPALLAPIIGPPLGGFITTYASWHWIFFINVPLGVIAIFLSWRMMPGQTEEFSRSFDIMGFILTGLAMLCLVAGLEMFSQQQVSLIEAGATIALGILALMGSLRHLRRYRDPLLSLTSFAIPSFRITMRGGFILRATISSAPFMLPLMFQVGFGMNAFEAGSMVLAVFAGNLAMKPATTPLIRYFGFRRLLIGNGVACVVTILLCAFLTPNSPAMITLALLFLGGLSRSMQFTAISSLAFADVPSNQMSSANTLFSTSLQLANGLGVTMAALSIRIGEILGNALDLSQVPGIGFRIGFAIIALITALGVYDMVRLAPDAGLHVSRKSR